VSNQREAFHPGPTGGILDVGMNDKDMIWRRSSGVLLHPTSLSGPHGIGDLGPEARRLADFLGSAGQSWWQMLPVGPPGFADSPYAALSAFAGSPLLISPEELVADGFLKPGELGLVGGNKEKVDYGKVSSFKMGMLRQAFAAFESRGDAGHRANFDGFCSVNGSWLGEYALYMALKGDNHGIPWNRWPKEVRGREPAALAAARKRLDGEVRFWMFIQWCFGRQWEALRTHCRGKGVQLMGDMPIFVNQDSSDVWANPALFRLDSSGNPEVVAGVPPDYFSAEGQRWGNPVYRWDALRGQGYGWWVDRFRRTFSLFDAVRIDHFIGFHRHWEIPAGGKARDGKYAAGPGAHFFETVKAQLGSLPLLAEDLGIVTPEVTALRKEFGFPGMRVLQFAFGGEPDGTNPYLLHNCTPDSFIYTGTHDNDTTAGWFSGTEGMGSTRTPEHARKERDAFSAYIGQVPREPNWEMIRLAMMSVCAVAVIPAQDLLGLGSAARMNVPGVDGGNWQWRMVDGALTTAIAERLAKLTRMHGRFPVKG